MMIDEAFIKNFQAYRRLKDIFENGYVPSRYLSYYSKQTVQLTNALGHAAFNLTDPLLKLFSREERGIFALGLHVGEGRLDIIKERLINNLSCFGLEVKPCKKNAAADSQSWKVAIFTDEFGSDYHILKQEKSGIWTHKPTFYQNLQAETNLPMYIDARHHEYIFGETLMITNPKGREVSDNFLSKIEENSRLGY